jgi:hypothetical protein
MSSERATCQGVQVAVGEAVLDGQLELPPGAQGVVLFPHGRGIGRGESDTVLASALREAGLATFLIDLLTAQEADLDARKAAFRFDMQMLARRLVMATDWVAEQPEMSNLPIGYFCVGYTTATAVHAAAQRPDRVRVVVIHDAVVDLVDKVPPRVSAAVLQIGGRRQILQSGADKQFVEVPALVAAHKSEEVARLAANWFTKHFADASRDSRTTQNMA